MIFSAQVLALMSGKCEFCKKNKHLEFEHLQKMYLSQYDIKSYNSTNNIAVVYPIKPKI